MKRKCSSIELFVATGFLCVATFLSSSSVSHANVAKELGNAFADAVDKAMPSVVVVRTAAVVNHRGYDIFYGFYSIPETLAGQGSGVIISKDGYVLTNNHVIQNAQEIEVVLNDGSKLTADLVGTDRYTDIAVLKIREEGEYAAIEPGDSKALRVGEFVIAIGSPFSLSGTVTVGSVSHKGRMLGMLRYENFIQTDASINPGNSGGPLVDVEGKLLGINTLIHTGSPYDKGNVGIGFAVPAHSALRIATSFIEKGKVERPWIGIQLREFLAGGQGIYVAEVFRNTPADQGGLKEGDIITHVDGTSVDSIHDLQQRIVQREIGDAVQLNILREKKELELELITDVMPEYDTQP